MWLCWDHIWSFTDAFVKSDVVSVNGPEIIPDMMMIRMNYFLRRTLIGVQFGTAVYGTEHTSLLWYWIVFYGVIHFPSGLPPPRHFRLEFMQAASQGRSNQSPAAPAARPHSTRVQLDANTTVNLRKPVTDSLLFYTHILLSKWLFPACPDIPRGRRTHLCLNRYEYFRENDHSLLSFTLLPFVKWWLSWCKCYKYRITYFEMEYMNINKRFWAFLYDYRNHVSFQHPVCLCKSGKLWPSYTCPHNIHFYIIELANWL